MGANVFFDMKYIEASTAFFSTSLKTTTDELLASCATDSTFSGFSAGLYAKAPLSFWRITLYPFAGLEYSWYLDYSLNEHGVTSDPRNTIKPVSGIQQKPTELASYSVAQDYNALWLKAGLGLDIQLGRRFFFRGEAAYGFRLENQYEKDFANSIWVVPGELAQGFTFKAAFGWRLGKVNKTGTTLFGQGTETQGTYPASFDGKWNGPAYEQFIFSGNRYTTNAIRGQVERGTFTYTSQADSSGSITFEREEGIYGVEWLKDAYEPLTIRYGYTNNQLILHGDTEIMLER
jgi:hypothetical protein